MHPADAGFYRHYFGVARDAVQPLFAAGTGMMTSVGRGGALRLNQLLELHQEPTHEVA